MKKDLYYRAVFQRIDASGVSRSLLYSLSSIPRLLLEVFIRKDFGERYFSLPLAIITTALLALWPLQPLAGDIFPAYLTWYAYLIAFFYMSLKHQQDMKSNPSVFDFKKFSLYTGKVNPVFFKIRLPDRETDIRRVECLLEPAAFFIAGLGLYLIGQALGVLLMGCSLLYGLSYHAAYVIGDHFVMDKIDEMICNEELENSFVNDMSEDETRGFRPRGRKPNGKELRKKLLPFMTGSDEILTAE